MRIKAGSANVSVYYYIVGDADNAKPGEPVTGLLFSDIETGGSASYVRQGALSTDLTLITLADAEATHDNGGFIEVSASANPGLYRCDYPDAAFVTGVNQTFCQIVIASGKNAVAAPILVDIDDNVDQAGDNFTRIGAGGINLTSLIHNIADGIAQSGSSNTIRLAAGESFGTNILRGNAVTIIAGLGAGQSRLISAYVNATDLCTVVPDFLTDPDDTSIYEVTTGVANLMGILDAALIEGAFDRIANNWSNFYNNENTQSPKRLDDVGGQALPGGRWTWSTATSGVPNPGRIRGNNATIASITELSIHQETVDGDNLGVLISALRSGDRVGIFFAVNPDNFLIFDVTATPILTGSVYAVTGTVDSTAGSFVNSSINVAYLITGDAASAVANRVEMDDNSVDLNTIISGVAAIPTTAMRGTDGVDTATMRGTDGANTVVPDAAGVAPTAVENRQEMDTNSLDLNSLISGQSTINGNVLAIDTAPMRGTDGANTVVPDVAGTAPTVAEILAGGDIDGFTLEESQRLILAASVGVLAGAATSSITIQAADGSKTRITATVDADGNRSAVVKDVTG